MTKYKKSFEKRVIKIQRKQDAYKFWREITEITSSINSRVRLWKINNSGRGCSFHEFYEWYIFQLNTRVYIINTCKLLWARVFFFSRAAGCFGVSHRPKSRERSEDFTETAETAHEKSLEPRVI